jgi:calcium load-activated calcium channel
MVIRLQFTFAVGLVGFCGVLISELLAWFFVYRQQKYRTTLAEIRRLSRKADELRFTILSSASKQYPVLNDVEAKLKTQTQTLQWMRMKASIFSYLFYILVVPWFNRLYEGVVVARLPFEPIFLFRSLTHHGLKEFNENDCSSVYLYVLFVAFFSTTLQKLLGYAPPAASMNNSITSLLQPSAEKRSV